MGKHKAKPRVGHKDWKLNSVKKIKMTQEDLLADPTITFVCGIDESGTGSAAGPMSVGCCVLPVGSTLQVKDSKRYGTEKAKQAAYKLVKENAEFSMVEMASAAEIDRYGMAPAKDYITFKLLERVVKLYHKDDTIIIMDGAYIPKRLPDFLKGYRVIAIPKADNTIRAVSAASIIAKVEKDAALLEQVRNDTSLQCYGFETNKAYLSKEHIASLKQYGLSSIHRQSISSLKEYIK